MTDVDPLAALEEIVGPWYQDGQCCAGCYCTNNIHGLTLEDSQQVRQAVRPALTAAREHVQQLTEDRDAWRDQVVGIREQQRTALAERDAAEATVQEVVIARNSAMRERDEERRAKEGNIAALNTALQERDDARAALVALTRTLEALRAAPPSTGQNSECVHPGIEHGPHSHTGTCPRCRRCTFIGHGPLCVDCVNDPAPRWLVTDPLAPLPAATATPEEGDIARCRTCTRPLWFEHTERGRGLLPAIGWSDRSSQDALTCFNSADYKHAPLTGRELAIWNAALTEVRDALGDIRAEDSAAGAKAGADMGFGIAERISGLRNDWPPAPTNPHRPGPAETTIGANAQHEPELDDGR